MLLITPPAAGTKASTHFTQHSFSFPFYFSTNKNIVILNKQLGVSLISVFSLRWFGRAFFRAAFLALELWLGKAWSESRCHTQSAAVCNPNPSRQPRQPSSAVCSPSSLTWPSAKCPRPHYSFSRVSEPFLPPLAVTAVPPLRAQNPNLPLFLIQRQTTAVILPEGRMCLSEVAERAACKVKSV